MATTDDHVELVTELVQILETRILDPLEILLASDELLGPIPVQLAVRDHRGHGTPVLLLHGLGGTLLHWDAVAPLLTGAHPPHRRPAAPARARTGRQSRYGRRTARTDRPGRAGVLCTGHRATAAFTTGLAGAAAGHRSCRVDLFELREGDRHRHIEGELILQADVDRS
ncbi:hypothetical protein HW130_25415 [Streptomyces sp. PKU-EA00015]|uniref:hypothetical protein n=1 Tax=Streptomyces sp. PKU-EA00015 TaxID=2748326 RepID=UPI0015A4ACEA|nr:hypothetical protein [Streptomyces sp. PKU-EA00015]NWF29551.1 hypothetical protein [Streptomyces sp. PKU-EA00015]